LSQKYKNAVIIDNAYESYMDLKDVLEQLEEHIQQNVIKVISYYLNNIFVIITNYQIN
jgi:uncharacterized protein (DUF302 family)